VKRTIPGHCHWPQPYSGHSGNFSAVNYAAYEVSGKSRYDQVQLSDRVGIATPLMIIDTELYAMDNSRLWAVQTSLDLENWSIDDWSPSGPSDQWRFTQHANGGHGGSPAVLLEGGVEMLIGNNFTALQISELENLIEIKIQRTLQAYFGTSATGGSHQNRGGLIPSRVESRRHTAQQPRNFTALRSSLRLSRGLHRLPSNESLKKSTEMQSDSKDDEPVPVTPLVHESTQRPSLDSTGKNISVVVGGFFAFFATFGTPDIHGITSLSRNHG
jgi:hypothetical protein